MEMTREEVNMGIEEIRKSRGVSKKACMRQLGILSYATYRKLEEDPKRLTREQQETLADFLRVDIDAFFSKEF